MKDIVIIRADDWQALYVNGCLDYEDHDVLDEAIEHSEIRVSNLSDKGDRALSDGKFQFPVRLADIPAKYLDKNRM